jgi:dGTPase
MGTAGNLILEREAAWLAPFAMHSRDSAGRRHVEPEHAFRSYRGPFQRDRDRIVHSSAFRRLSHKTQVFTGEMGDYHRTRLTHTLEVSSIARTIARALRLNEDLVEALSLAHDIGHPPFGHSGEDVLEECLSTEGGFNHNAQALRICELIETRYVEFPGLNLTLEVLEGQSRRAHKGEAAGGAGGSTPLLEVQVVDAADSIAYDAHDADDSLEIGLLQLGELLEVPLWREARTRVVARYASLDDASLRRAIVHELLDWQVRDVIGVVEREIAAAGMQSVEDVRRAAVIVLPSAELGERKRGLEKFLFERVYRHSRVLDRRTEAQGAVREMFHALVRLPQQLPEKFRRIAERDGLPRAVGDYLAGMTDRFAFEEHRRLILGAASIG